MALKFPTMAEQALLAFRSGTFKSLKRAAAKFGAEVSAKEGATIYTFDDDTWLESCGRGRNHKVVARLP